VEQDLELMIGDKSGMFGITSMKSFEEKKIKALEKNFKEVGERGTGMTNNKKEVREILMKSGTEWLAGRINSCDNNWLIVFFSIKTHKDDWPLRSIISEKGAWVNLLSWKIKTMINSMQFEDPFEVKNSEEAISRMKEFHGKEVVLKSYDVSDMYFEMDIGIVIQLFKKKIESKSTIEFQNKNKVDVKQAVRLLELYLDSMCIKLDDRFFKPIKGACIGSQAAPALCRIYMEEFHKKVYQELKQEIERLEVLIMRFVDDFDTIITNQKSSQKINDVFESVSKEMRLKLTQETEIEGKGLQFLDLHQTSEKGLCVMYDQRSEKPILPYKSNHSKNVFEGIVMSALKNAAAKSCPCKSKYALQKQEKRMRKQGYPREMIDRVKRKIISKKPKKEWEVRRVGIAPQIHKLTHNMKRIGRDFNLQINST
jgi:hypothetical protein